MDTYYYINAIFSANEVRSRINVEAVVVNKCHELNHCPILSVRHAIINREFSQLGSRAIKDMGSYAMELPCCKRIDFSEYQAALGTNINVITIEPAAKE